MRTRTPFARARPPRWRNQSGGASWRSARSHSRPAIQLGELLAERAIDLDVRLVPLRHAEEARPQREERRVRREITPVVEIPAEDSHGTPLPDRRGAYGRGAGRPGRPRARAEGRPAVVARARGQIRGARVRQALDPHARVVRRGRVRARRPPGHAPPGRAPDGARRVAARRGARDVADGPRDRRANRAARAASRSSPSTPPCP